MTVLLAKIGQFFCEWNTSFDAPTTPRLTGNQLPKFIKRQYGESGLWHLRHRLAEIEKNGGVSGYNSGLKIMELIASNRAGLGGTRIPYAKELIHQYRQSPIEQLVARHNAVGYMSEPFQVNANFFKDVPIPSVLIDSTRD